ncbi:MAG: hypothetical protein IJD96_09130 [Lachnospiraceae bacterium]|nr:hypothetical protein [Lachnospiraceae bacterium]
MGTTFINLQVKGKVQKTATETYEKGYRFKQTATEWFSVFEKNDEFAWGKLCKVGRQISKEADTLVIAVSYFDDDDFLMYLFKDGKAIGTYQAGSERNWCSGSTRWIAELNLSKEEASAFRYLLKKELTAEESITVFSKLLGIKLFADVSDIEEQQELWTGNAKEVIQEIKDEKKRTQVKNHTNAVLLQEIPGMFRDYDREKGVFQVVYPGESGKFLYHHIHCLEMRENGLFEVHDFKYPKTIFRENSRYLGIEYAQNWISVTEDVTGYGKTYPIHEYEDELLQLMEVPKENLKRENEMPQLDSIYGFSYIGSYVDENRYEYYTWFHSTCGGELRKVDCKTPGKTLLQKDVVAVYEYENRPNAEAYWSGGLKRVTVTERQIVCLRIQYQHAVKDVVCDVRFFDKNLKLFRKEEIFLPRTKWEDDIAMEYAYCEKNDCIYYGNKKIDLITHEVNTGIAELNTAQRLFVHYNLAGEGFLYAIDRSFVYILDLDLNLISVHRLKGHVIYYFTNINGNVELVTSNSSVGGRDKPDNNSAIRLYEIIEKS